MLNSQTKSLSIRCEFTIEHISCNSFLLHSGCKLVVVIAVGDNHRKIVNEQVICQSEGPQTLSCPVDHMVVIRSATYYRSVEPGCHPTDNNTCLVRDQITLFRKCYQAQQCQIGVSAVAIGNCSSDHRGDVYLKLAYQCEPSRSMKRFLRCFRVNLIWCVCLSKARAPTRSCCFYIILRSYDYNMHVEGFCLPICAWLLYLVWNNVCNLKDSAYTMFK